MESKFMLSWPSSQTRIFAASFISSVKTSLCSYATIVIWWSVRMSSRCPCGYTINSNFCTTLITFLFHTAPFTCSLYFLLKLNLLQVFLIFSPSPPAITPSPPLQLPPPSPSTSPPPKLLQLLFLILVVTFLQSTGVVNRSWKRPIVARPLHLKAYIVLLMRLMRLVLMIRLVMMMMRLVLMKGTLQKATVPTMSRVTAASSCHCKLQTWWWSSSWWQWWQLCHNVSMIWWQLWRLWWRQWAEWWQTCAVALEVEISNAADAIKKYFKEPSLKIENMSSFMAMSESLMFTWGRASRRKQWQHWATAWTWKWQTPTRIAPWTRPRV